MGYSNGGPYQNNVVQSGNIEYKEYAVPHRMGGMDGNFVSNYAYADGALLNGEPETGGTADDIIGADATLEEIQSKSFYEELSFDFDSVFEWDEAEQTLYLHCLLYTS